ncbi:MAG: type II toxin-antitoxin system VapC family toxin [Sphingobacteriales bacterium]|nr:type II toxin-antitoxin system VapC family toxin [Sphingobacteriales bacterium]
MSINLFIDTSSIFCLYHYESGTNEMEEIFHKQKISTIFLAEITKLEFESAVWKKVRTKEIDKIHALQLLTAFEKDFSKYHFVSTDNTVIETAKLLLSKYGSDGLRTLDSIQLATAVVLKKYVQLNKCADKLLEKLMLLEGLNTQ